MRLRAERTRLGLNQADLARIGGVSRNSQTAYESGKTPFTSEYLVCIAEAGLDPLYIITGGRSKGALSDEQARILEALDAVPAANRDALLNLVFSLSGKTPSNADLSLPSTAALSDALAGFFEASPDLSGDELVHELATSLPIILRAAADEIDDGRSDQRNTEPSPRAVGHAGHRVAQPVRRS